MLKRAMTRILIKTFLYMLPLGVSMSAVCRAETAKAEENSEVVTFVDDLGREISVSDPRRVAAMLGSYGEIWSLAGGTVCACADDAWEDFELEMPEDAVNIGMTKEPSMEKLLAAEPDFVLASTKTQANLNMLDTLESAGITTAYFEVSDFQDYLDMLKICTEITGREDLYEENGLKVQEQVEAVQKASEERLKNQEAPKVLVLRVSAAGVVVKSGEGNVLGEMLAGLGCINIADKESGLLENLNIEYILQEDPDYIFTVQQGDDTEAAEQALKELYADGSPWSQLTAVKEGKTYHMDKRLYNLKPNARWGEAYEELERILSNE